MTFIQVIDTRTSKIDEIRELSQQWRAATEGKRTLQRAIVAQDRNDADHHLVLAFFEDHAAAMTNSQLPETGDFAQKQAELLDAPPVFIDLDVLEDQTSESMTLAARSFADADEHRTPPLTTIDVVGLGPVTAARLTLEPGWRWSECIKPIAGTQSCQARHVGTAVAGKLGVRLEDGTEVEVVPGSAYVVPPGHDAWVIGDEAFVAFEFDTTTAQTYAANR